MPAVLLCHLFLTFWRRTFFMNELALIHDVVTSVGQAQTLDQAIERAVQCVAKALGAREFAVLDVLSVQADGAELRTWENAQSTQRTRRFSCPAGGSEEVAATRSKTVVLLSEGALPHSYKIIVPVFQSDCCTALMIFSGVVSSGDKQRLQLLCDTLAELLNQKANQENRRATLLGGPTQELDLLNAVFDSLPVGVVVFEPTELRVVALNAHAEREFIVNRSAVCGKTVAGAFGKRVSAMGEPALRKALEELAHVEDNFQIDTLHGRRLFNLRHLALRTSLGQPRWVLTLARDVTEEHQRQLELNQAKEVSEIASQTKTHFIANISHEIRTPINGILGLTEVLLGTPLSDQQRRSLETVYKSGEMLLGLVNDVLDFSKIQAGNFALVETEFSLLKMVKTALTKMTFPAHEKGIKLRFIEASALPHIIRADPQRLCQVLTNVVANAIKFTEKGGVVVSLGVQSLNDQARLCFTVSDTGIGISPEMQSKLFSAFTQESAGLSRRYGGVGLGLNISRQLLELMGGSIHFSSKVGLGTQVEFSLPLVLAHDDACPSPPVQTQAFNVHVLIIEDNLVNQEVMAQMLRTMGCHVHISHSGHAGLDCLQSMRFDLVLMDIQMPGMDGVETLRQFRAAPEKTLGRPTFSTPLSTPVIAVTANTLESDAARYRSLGFDGYLSKPFRKNQLLAMLNQHVKNPTPGNLQEPASLSVPAPDVLDAQALQRLHELDPNGENQLITRVVNAFEVSVKRLMPQLALALPGLDLAAVRHVAHTLKSSSASLGAIKLSQMCSELENLSRLGKTEGVADLAALLQAEVEVVRAALQKLLSA